MGVGAGLSGRMSEWSSTERTSWILSVHTSMIFFGGTTNLTEAKPHMSGFTQQQRPQETMTLTYRIQDILMIFLHAPRRTKVVASPSAPSLRQ